MIWCLPFVRARWKAVETKQLEILSHLTTFSQSLKRTTREVIARRKARRRVKKKFSFSNMDERL
ncbi:unnamed protein product, partial [Symbiodinium sp. CCMP2456]